MKPLKAPWPHFGGKSRVADVIWDRFGNVTTYIEPFAGSLAVLLARPHEPKFETVNDRDAYIANLWRSLKWDPEGVAEYADWPNNEADIFARHNWLARRAVFRERMCSDPEYFDIRVAGYWLWEAGLRIGSGAAIVPDHSGTHSKPKNNPNGIHGLVFREQYLENFRALSARLRWVRVLCGDWSRCLTPVEIGTGLTGILLDPPYAGNEYVYAEQSTGVAHEVREWALANGDNPQLRIALCGYREHKMPDSWTTYRWKAVGGYGNQGHGRGRENAELETIHFSPHCLKPMSLFDEAA